MKDKKRQDKLIRWLYLKQMAALKSNQRYYHFHACRDLDVSESLLNKMIAGTRKVGDKVWEKIK